MSDTDSNALLAALIMGALSLIFNLILCGVSFESEQAIKELEVVQPHHHHVDPRHPRVNTVCTK